MTKLPQEKVYIVDDDEAMRNAVSSILRSVGYQVETLARGEDFIALADKGLSGCAVLDVRLPGPSGLEVQRRIADAGHSIPIVFITGHGDIAMAVQAMKANAVEFLTKPFRDQDLLDAISLAMERDRERRRAEDRVSEAAQKVASLSTREYVIFNYLCEGRLGKQIAHDLELSEATVKVHRRNIMIKLGVASMSQLILQFGHLHGAASSEPRVENEF